MSIATLLALASETFPERVAFSDGTQSLSYGELNAQAGRIAGLLRAEGVESLAMLAANSCLYPALIFGAAMAGVPFVPLNYRLTNTQLQAQAKRLGNSLLVVDGGNTSRITHPVAGLRQLTVAEFLAALPAQAPDDLPYVDSAEAACWLFTSGTTGEPKIALLAHEKLTAYIYSSVEPFSASDEDVVLASVPPYHIAGLAGVLSNVFACRRVIYLENFSAELWVDTVVREKITQAMLVPTMLQRVLPHLQTTGQKLPDLKTLSYGGGRMPRELITAAMAWLPHVGFTNAYGLTETSSTITLLSPEDHRQAAVASDEAGRARLGSVGRPLPGVEIEVRLEDGSQAAADQIGEIWVRSEQVAGSYAGKGSMLVEGWFCTRDQGWLDGAGYLFLIGRVDDVIVRGGENISPGEIEDVIRTMPEVADVAVVAKADTEWGEVPVAFVVTKPDQTLEPAAICALVRKELRSTREPAEVRFVAELPYNETGKLLRGPLRESLMSSAA